MEKQMKRVGNYYVQDDDSFFQFQYDRGFPMDGSLHSKIVESVPNGNALDVGAHVGIWSRTLTKKFKEVYAWEPIESNCECLRTNAPNAKIFPFAAASKQGKSKAQPDIEGNYGGYFLDEEGDEDVLMKVIDDFDFRDITFIQLNTKGMEYEALLGMKKTIQTYKPTIVYQAYDHQLYKYKHSSYDIERFLTNLDYTIEVNKDFREWDITYFIAK